MQTSRTKPARCTCGNVHHAATSVFGNHQPSPGDFAICDQCARINRYTDTLLLRPMDPSELDVLPADTREQLSKAQALVRLWLKRSKLN
jgi:hypothetical protein